MEGYPAHTEVSGQQLGKDLRKVSFLEHNANGDSEEMSNPGAIMFNKNLHLKVKQGREAPWRCEWPWYNRDQHWLV